MTKKFGRFTNQQIKHRFKNNKPVWLWKWTVDAYIKFKENKKGCQDERQ